MRSVTVETEKRQTQLSVAAKELEKLQARLGKESSAKWKLEAQLQTQTTEFKECSAQLKSTSTSRWKLHEELQAKVTAAPGAKLGC